MLAKLKDMLRGGAGAGGSGLPAVRNEMRLVDITSWDVLTGQPGAYGLAMSPEIAMKHSAVFRAVSLIGGVISMLPLHTFLAKGADDRERHEAGGVARLLAERPNPRMSAATFWRTLAADMLLSGNGYAWIDRAPSGRARALWPIPSPRMSPRLIVEGPLSGILLYRFTLDDGKTMIEAHQDDVLHLPGTPIWEGHKAKSPLTVYAESVGIGIDANSLARDTLRNDTTPPGFIKYPVGKTVTPEQAQTVRAYWELMQGGKNRGKPAILSDGAEFVQTQIKAVDAQLLETRQFQIEDVARVFGVPPHMIGAVEKSTSWGSGIEEQTNGFLTFTLGAHLIAIEQEINAKVYGYTSFFAEFERRALVQMTLEKRGIWYRVMLGGSAGPGAMTVNEVRKRENLPPIDGGDQLVKWDMTSARSGAASEPASDPDPATHAPPPSDKDQKP